MIPGSHLVQIALVVAAACVLSPFTAEAASPQWTFQPGDHWFAYSCRLHHDRRTTSLQEHRFIPGREQSNRSSCGPSALANLLSVFFQVPVDEGSVTEGTGLNQGSSLAELVDSAHRLGFDAKVYRMDLGALLNISSELRIPVILLLESPVHHFVIAIAPVYRGILIFDPEQGFAVIPQGQLDRRWPGLALVVDPGPNLIDVCTRNTSLLAKRFEARQRHLAGLCWATR